MISTSLRWSLIGLLLLTIRVVHGEGGCPAGFQPSGAAPSPQNPVACRPIQNYDRQQTQRPPPPQWVTRWGAIAADSAKGILGTASSMADGPLAESTATADCRSKGGSNCTLQLSYGNQCAVVVVGDLGYNATQGITLDLAKQEGLRVCNQSDSHCHVYYSDCSLPQRIQ